MDDVLDAGPRRRRRTGESLRHLPLRQGWLGPALHFCASTSPLPMPLTKSERPGSRPRAVPAPLHRADNGRARGMSHLPTARPDKHRRPVGRDQPASAEGRQVSQPSAKTVARGYGARHKALRKCWAAQVARGGVCCARCGGVIFPDEPWDLGHDDHDRTRYTGPEHRACNRATAAHKAKRRRKVACAFVEPLRHVSRAW